jgi:hypothetical protein
VTNSKSELASSRCGEKPSASYQAGSAQSVFARDAETAAFQLAEDKSIDARYASLLEYFEALASQWMERVADLSPSQMRAVVQCSSQ